MRKQTKLWLLYLVGAGLCVAGLVLLYFVNDFEMLSVLALGGLVVIVLALGVVASLIRRVKLLPDDLPFVWEVLFDLALDELHDTPWHSIRG